MDISSFLEREEGWGLLDEKDCNFLDHEIVLFYLNYMPLYDVQNIPDEEWYLDELKLYR